ncbi:MAG: GNAT family N-acetyltransferase [Chloroflexi bacterium]|nr:GNAT family N-acetyltransferase [Chloroflexota bacterium]
MPLSLQNVLRRCEAQAVAVARRGRAAVPVGPFLALLDPTTDLIWLNYAVPVAPIEGAELDAALPELSRVFAEHGRVPRFEFTEELWPDLGPALEGAGFQLQARQPTMVCTAAAFEPYRAPGVEVRLLRASDPDDDLARFHAIISEGFGAEDSRPAGREELARFRSQLEVGSLRCALASVEGAPAGAGSTTPWEDVCELAGVATVPARRRRGAAATLSSFLVADHFGRGGTLVWLSAGDEVARRVYEKIGFSLVATRLNYVLTYTGA